GGREARRLLVARAGARHDQGLEQHQPPKVRPVRAWNCPAIDETARTCSTALERIPTLMNTHWSAAVHAARSQRPSGDQTRSPKAPSPRKTCRGSIHGCCGCTSRIPPGEV